MRTPGFWVAVFALSSVPRVAAAAVPTIQSFTATVTDLNRIKLNWNVTGGVTGNQVYIYEDVGPEPVSCPATEKVGCSVTLRVRDPGVYRYVLSATNASGTRTAVVEANVPDSLTPPVATNLPIHVDMYDVQPQTFSWTHAGPGYVRVTPPGSFFTLGTQFPASGSYSVSAGSLGLGQNSYSLAYCEAPAPSEQEFCSSNVEVTYSVEGAKIAGEYREFVPAGQPVTLTWSGSGNGWYVDAPTLGVSTWVSAPQYTFTAAQLTSGIHQVSITTCDFKPGDIHCSNRWEIYSPGAGTLTFTAASGGLVLEGGLVGTLAPDAGGTVNLNAPRTGTFYGVAASGTHVDTGADLAMVISQDNTYHDIVVGSPASVPVWTEVPWQQAFTASAFDVWTRSTTGSPLDITFDSSGDIWGLGEFSKGVAHVQAGVLTHHDVPLRHNLDSQSGLLSPVAPFGNPLGFDGSSSVTALGEKVLAVGSSIWFTEGGTLLHQGTFPNHSRLVRFDKSATDSAATPYDDRFCTIHVPGDDNEIIGSAWDGTRLWVAESRPSATQSALSWLVPGDFTGACDDLLDYSDPAAVAAAAAANHCSSPSQTRCLHEVLLPAAAGRATHLQWDSQGYIWFTDMTGKVLGRYTVASGALKLYPLPPPHTNTSIVSVLFQGFPWQLRVDANAVYVGEYSDMDLLRFDKKYATPSACESLVNGKNPCITELYVPKAWAGMALHSVAVRSNHLWFTLTNESDAPDDPTASQFGYVDVSTWAAGAPSGVLYTNLSTLGSVRPGEHHAFRGIELSSTGQLALADMRSTELLRLTPLP